jgi:hypothetical protein
VRMLAERDTLRAVPRGRAGRQTSCGTDKKGAARAIGERVPELLTVRHPRSQGISV